MSFKKVTKTVFSNSKMKKKKNNPHTTEYTE